jgi:predicted TPR repeat methyltransferase
MIQSKEELEKWYERNDPWDYENSPHDSKRKDIFLSELPTGSFEKVLDIGCGNGFITNDLPGKSIIGVDISSKAIEQAKSRCKKDIKFIQASIFDLGSILDQKFDLIIITGVLYPQWIGNTESLIYTIIDNLLADNGYLVSVHIDSWYRARFPYLLVKDYNYDFREFIHKFEVYIK